MSTETRPKTIRIDGVSLTEVLGMIELGKATLLGQAGE